MEWITSDIFALFRTVAIAKPGAYCLRACVLDISTKAMVTSLDLNGFLKRYSGFVKLRGPVNTVIFDDGSTFWAASEQLPKLLQSTEFHNALRKSDIIWTRILPCASGRGGIWKNMVKLFKTALFRVLENTCRLSTLIE